jgi:hypothetical protein
MQPNKNGSQTPMPVMDIQHPVSSPSPGPVVIKPSASLGRPATMEYTRPRVDNANTQTFNPAADMERVQQMSQEPAELNAQKKPSKKPLIITLIIALVLLLTGGGVTYYFVMKSDSSAPVVNQPEPTSEPATNEITATPDGVDKTIQSIDQGLNSLNDDTDYSPNDINDDALGL